jgi:type IV pilus assembly protein PilC
MEFVCKYAKTTGEVVKMVQVGQTADDVRHHLQEQGFLPISVEPRGWTLAGGGAKKSAKIDPQDFIVFNQQFVALIKAGLPILRSLDLLRAQIKNPTLRRHIEDVRERVHSGALLSEALRAQGVFPTVYTASILAGERSGNLVDVINRFIQYEKTVLSVRKRFLGALIYPSFLIVISIVMVMVIVTYVIPRFGQLYAGLNTPLPTPTKVLIAVSTTAQQNLIIGVPAVVVVLVGFVVWAGTPGGKDRIDDFKLRAPILGHLWTMFSMAQLSRTLSTLLQGGIPLLAALEVSREATGNRIIAHSIADAIVGVREGQSLSDSLERTGHFPDLAVEMMRVGEQTGSLPDMLNHVSDFYDEDVAVRSAALLAWVEPVILIFVAIFVASILISLYLPIFSIGNAVHP